MPRHGMRRQAPSPADTMPVLTKQPTSSRGGHASRRRQRQPCPSPSPLQQPSPSAAVLAARQHLCDPALILCGADVIAAAAGMAHGSCALASRRSWHGLVPSDLAPFPAPHILCPLRRALRTCVTRLPFRTVTRTWLRAGGPLAGAAISSILRGSSTMALNPEVKWSELDDRVFITFEIQARRRNPLRWPASDRWPASPPRDAVCESCFLTRRGLPVDAAVQAAGVPGRFWNRPAERARLAPRAGRQIPRYFHSQQGWQRTRDVPREDGSGCVAIQPAPHGTRLCSRNRSIQSPIRSQARSTRAICLFRGR